MFVIRQDGCWSWRGYIDNWGYGKIGRFGKQTIGAHRASWELSNGPIPAGLCVLHRCDNRVCTNPEHLFLGTRPDNTADMIAKGRGKSLTCDDHPRRKISSAEARTIFLAHRAGANFSQLARQYQLTQPAISSICKRKTWRQVTEGL